MTEFRYLKETIRKRQDLINHNNFIDEIIIRGDSGHEIAYQLKRIADILSNDSFERE